MEMETEIDTNSTDIAIVPGRTPSERLNMDIVEEMKNRSRSVKLYKNDKKAQFIELRARGASFQDIADILNCGKSTLIGWNKEMSDEIAERRAMTKNDILCDYQVARDNRLRYFAELYRNIKNELARRTLRDVPSDKPGTARIFSPMLRAALGIKKSPFGRKSKILFGNGGDMWT